MKIIIILGIIAGLVTAGCRNRKTVALTSNEYYTCSMHPQVMQDRPGTCPICHMKLIVVKKTNTAPDEIELNDEQIRLGNIHIDTLRLGSIGDQMVLTATLNADETKVNSVNARIRGRIDRLYFKNAGDYVKRGDRLYDLYSEELNTAKQEYIAALERRETLDNSIIDFQRLLESARSKLLLWGMTEQQIRELARTRKAPALTGFYSPVSGYISELPVMEGQYVMEGGTILKLTDLSSLWAEAQVYESERSQFSEGESATVEFPDIPGLKLKGKIAFANPEISRDTRVNLVRVPIPGNNRLRPGMPAYVTIRSRAVRTLTLPTDAVLRDGKMNTVWVQSGKNRFRMKMVHVGKESGDRIEIQSGLKDGDVVVSSGAYLLNSEYIFKKGANTMGGMNMNEH